MQMETERLSIRRFSSADWRDLHAYLSDETVVRYEPYGVYTEEECKESALKRSQNDAFWAVCLKENNKLIGNLYFQQQDPKEFQRWALGFIFNPRYYGKGYATESCNRILRYGFEELEALRIIAMCNPDNTPSWKLLERLNMRREGHLLKHKYFKQDALGRPIWTDTYEYAILAEEWFASGTVISG